MRCQSYIFKLRLHDPSEIIFIFFCILKNVMQDFFKILNEYQI